MEATEAQKRSMQAYYKKNKKCVTLQRKEYYKKNKQKIDNRHTLYCVNNSERLKEYCRGYYRKNMVRLKRQMKAFRESVGWKKHRSQACREERQNNPKLRIDCSIGSAIYQSLKGKKAGQKWEDLVGYTVQDLMEYLEKQFDSRMNWDNYGRYWQLDHIKPKALFRYAKPEDKEFKECWRLDNLQPLEARANNIKGISYYV